MRNTVSLDKSVAEKKMLKPAAGKKSAVKKNTGNRSLAQPESTESVAGQIKTADVLIIGAGFAGLGTAIRLQQAGVKNIVILERSTDVGGTWRDNTYPGAACDIPSNLYSYSFAQNPDWSRSFSGSGEILDYIHHLVDKFGLRPLIRFQRNVTGLAFDESAGVWSA
ncbi:MAG: flavin-containing monooxygenase, partial [Pseudomonadota bacterium]